MCASFAYFEGVGIGSWVGSGDFSDSHIYNSNVLLIRNRMNTETQFPADKNGFYLRTFPWTDIPENLINAVKTDVSTFHSPGTWYWYDTYFWLKNGLPFSFRIINSSTKEWLVHYVSFLSKLYGWRVAFSLKPGTFLKKYEHSRSVGSFRRGKVFPMKSAGSVAGDDFEGSASFISSLIAEWLPQFKNGNGIVKVSFSFTASDGWHSRILEALILEKKKYGMSIEEKAVFEEAEKKKAVHRFLYRWKIFASGVSEAFPRVVRRTLRGYRSDRNLYRIADEKARHYPGNRLIDAEKLLSHWLMTPRSNPYRNTQKIPIPPVPPSVFEEGFAYHSS